MIQVLNTEVILNVDVEVVTGQDGGDGEDGGDGGDGDGEVGVHAGQDGAAGGETLLSPVQCSHQKGW